MAKRKTLKCSKCDRTFSMPGHLARHMNSMHKRGSKKSIKKRVSKRGPGRPRKGSGYAPTQLLSQLQTHEAELDRQLSAVREAIAALSA